MEAQAVAAELNTWIVWGQHARWRQCVFLYFYEGLCPEYFEGDILIVTLLYNGKKLPSLERSWQLWTQSTPKHTYNLMASFQNCCEQVLCIACNFLFGQNSLCSVSEANFIPSGISCCWTAVPSSESGLTPLTKQRHLTLMRKRPLH